MVNEPTPTNVPSFLTKKPSVCASGAAATHRIPSASRER